MSDLETRLTAALHAERPPTYDPTFRVEVLVRLEQARFRRLVRRIVAVAMLVGLPATGCAPALNAWLVADEGRVWLVAVMTALAPGALTLVMFAPRFRNAARTAGRLLYP